MTSLLQVHLIAGARPNFMKVAPLYHALAATDWARPVLVHTGQHYDAAMSDAFFTDLQLPVPDHHLGVGSANHAQQTARIMAGYDTLCDTAVPDWTIVVGDVNSTIACALVAAKRGISCAHLEAGLRSRDRSMPEEINRLLTDQACDLLWPPSQDGVDNLLAENVPAARIELVGNIMIDTLVMLQPAIAAAGVPESLGLSGYVLATFHRPANVDDPVRLATICEQLLTLAARRPVVFPVHPRTRARLNDAGLWARLAAHPQMHLLEPQGYIAFMSLVAQAGLIVTDSGGIQEETSYLGIPCLTVRPNTERPVTIDLGTNRLIEPGSIAQLGDAALDGARGPAQAIPLWDGHTAERVVASLARAAGVTAPMVSAAS
ncbi:non-hydrolyzing UDP-N-acetylglucosamine 2-epimerase [Rhodovibrio salinarum]|uniref:UDP-N-acetylglucosamine 2-epimerase (Non-hydrolyzing) n=1 Tax=Rhodovibrio salinarum TaxID=1087 RepID=A0A934QFD0_9PROT|nr:UDP-N-acetylglucosamine 2-epimerase (non-hydrolyzing) [Rhodovibrio salinarum]MBK1696022.1 UDP-N-acetylglucosamine 2-epimerase (non-hydrolyzing) [Rhodovibrio salinarum]